MISNTVKELVLVTSLLAFAVLPADAKVIKSADNGFTIEHELDVPVSPDEAFDSMTGDISGWWDHTFSGKPKALYIEPIPGGCFCEIFNNAGEGAEHARVTAVERGKLLRMVGPLGLAGLPFQMSMTITFSAAGEGTKIKMTGSAWGMMEDGWDKAVDGVWHHFLIEQYKPFVESTTRK